MGSWFGKGGSDSSPPPMMPMQQPQDNSAEMMAMMMGMMEAMSMNSMAMMEQVQQPQLPPMPQIPEIAREPVIDWTEKQDQLAAKAAADYNLSETRRKARTDTVLTSPLLEEEDATVTGSVLAG
jgi:hypothetical protein